MPTQPKMQDLKNQAIALAKSLGLHYTQTRHLKRHIAEDLDLRRQTIALTWNGCPNLGFLKWRRC